MLVLKGPTHRGEPVQVHLSSLALLTFCTETGKDVTYDTVQYQRKGTRFQGKLLPDRNMFTTMGWLRPKKIFILF